MQYLFARAISLYMWSRLCLCFVVIGYICKIWHWWRIYLSRVTIIQTISYFCSFQDLSPILVSKVAARSLPRNLLFRDTQNHLKRPTCALRLVSERRARPAKPSLVDKHRDVPPYSNRSDGENESADQSASKAWAVSWRQRDYGDVRFETARMTHTHTHVRYQT